MALSWDHGQQPLCPGDFMLRHKAATIHQQRALRIWRLLSPLATEDCGGLFSSVARENNSTGYFHSRFYLLGCVRKPSFHTDMDFSQGGNRRRRRTVERSETLIKYLSAE